MEIFFAMYAVSRKGSKSWIWNRLPEWYADAVRSKQALWSVILRNRESVRFLTWDILWGHAVEKLKNFTLLHGQCVGVGLVAAAYLSMKRGLLTKEEYQEICQGCSDYDLPVHVDGLIPEEVLSATKKDKKMEQGHIRFILMDGIGKSFIDKTVTDEEMLSCIQEITL